MLKVTITNYLNEGKERVVGCGNTVEARSHPWRRMQMYRESQNRRCFRIGDVGQVEAEMATDVVEVFRTTMMRE